MLKSVEEGDRDGLGVAGDTPREASAGEEASRGPLPMLMPRKRVMLVSLLLLVLLLLVLLLPAPRD